MGRDRGGRGGLGMSDPMPHRQVCLLWHRRNVRRAPCLEVWMLEMIMFVANDGPSVCSERLMENAMQEEQGSYRCTGSEELARWRWTYRLLGSACLFHVHAVNRQSFVPSISHYLRLLRELKLQQSSSEGSTVQSIVRQVSVFLRSCCLDARGVERQHSKRFLVGVTAH